MVVGVAARKEQLRASVVAARQQLSRTAMNRAGAAIAEHGLAELRGIQMVAAYLPIGNEPPTIRLVDGLLEAGTEVLLPVVDGFVLDWAPYDGPDALAPGPFGTSEPTTPRLGGDAVVDAAVVVVPALAVDRAGHRLGRGRGFYDRALIDVSAPVVALVYDAELVNDVPTEPHDRSVDAVLRPAGFISLR